MKAIEFFGQYLSTTKENDRCIYHSLSEAYLGLNNFKEAVSYGMKSLAFAKKKKKYT